MSVDCTHSKSVTSPFRPTSVRPNNDRFTWIETNLHVSVDERRVVNATFVKIVEVVLLRSLLFAGICQGVAVR